MEKYGVPRGPSPRLEKRVVRARAHGHRSDCTDGKPSLSSLDACAERFAINIMGGSPEAKGAAWSAIMERIRTGW